MKCILFSVVASMLVIVAHADDGTNTLWKFAKELQRAEKDSPPPIKLTAALKSQGRKHFLVFHLVNVAKKPLRLYPYELPWGSPHSLHLAAVTTDGVPLQNIYPIVDPGPESEIVVEPGASQEGEYAVHRVLDFEKASKEKDIMVLWSYRVPHGDGDHDSTCSGVVVIPSKK
jgi:hypothetical protein